MNETLSNRLDNCLVEIRRGLDIQETLMKLSVRGIFDINDRQLVLNDSIYKTNSEKRQKIVDLLKTREQSAYWEFCHIVEVRSANLFQLLHDFEEEDGMICTECTAGSSFQRCSYCRGLVDVFSMPENGKFIEKPDDIYDLFESMKSQLESKDQEIKRLVSECSKVKNDYNLCIARSVKDQDLSKQKEDALTKKEAEYNRLAAAKEEMSIQCERFKLKNEELRQKVDSLATKNNDLQEKVSHYERSPLYENDAVVFSSTIERLNSDLKKERQLLEDKEKEAMKTRLENSRLQIHTESLEELLKRQRTENNRVFTDLNNSHELLRTQLNAKYAEVDNLTEDLRVVKSEKEEAMKERDHLLNKVYEKSQSLNEAIVNYSTTERELQSTKKISKVQNENIQHLRKFKNDLSKQYQIVLEERNVQTEKCKRLTEEKDKLVLTLMDLQQHSDRQSDLEKLVGASENENQQKINMLEHRIAELRQTRPSDTEVTLKRLEGSRFGVKFGAKKGPVFLGESKVVVYSVDFTYNTTPLADIREGDFVVAINDVNVQEFEMHQVRSLCPNDALVMKLVLRRPTQAVPTECVINCNGFTPYENLEDVGLTVGFFLRVKEKSIAANIGLQDLDEITKISNADLNSCPLNELNWKLLKGGSRQKLHEVYIRRGQWNETFKRRLTSRSSSCSFASDNVFLNSSLSGSFIDIKPRPRTEKPFPRTPQENAFDSSDRSSSSSRGSHEDSSKKPVRPVPLPREPAPPLPETSGQFGDRRPSTSKLHTLEYTKTVGDYSYVASHSFDSNRNSILETDEHYRNNLLTLDVKKQKYESFGLQMVGGNKAGIYVHAVDNWQPAEKCGVRVGYRILKIGNFSMESVAFCYAVDVLQRHCAYDTVTFLFEDIPLSKYQEILKKKPYDSFHVRTLKPYQARLAGEISFNAGEVLCVTNSYVFVQPGQPFKWQAMKDELSGAYQISGLIPRQISSRSPSAIAEHTYEEIDDRTGLTKDRVKERGNGWYYTILEQVGDVLV